MPEVEVGMVSDFFAQPVVAGIDLSGTVKNGDKIHIEGHTTNIEMTITSMEIDHVHVEKAEKGQSIGIKVPDRVRRGDKVYRVT